MKDSFENIAIHDFPALEEVSFLPVEKKYLKVLILSNFFFFLILFLVLYLVDFYQLVSNQEVINYAYILLSVVFIYSATIIIVGFKKRKYLVRERDISYKKGVFFRKITTVPFQRIQHIEIDQGPVSRFFNLVSISIYTAGDSSDDLKIKGLDANKASQIKEFITQKIDA